MFNLVLILEAASCAAGGSKCGDEDVWRWAQGGELRSPLGGVVGHEGGELFLRRGSGGLRGATGDSVNACHGGVAQEVGEDVAPLQISILDGFAFWLGTAWRI